MNKNHFSIMAKGVAAWNQWRDENETIPPDLSGANLERFDLKGVNFIGADLNNAILRNADLTRAEFGGANLVGAILCGAILTNAELEEVIFRGADLSKANINKSKALRADFSEANLREVDFSYSSLNESKFRDSQLSKAILVKVDLGGADLSKADLRSANLRGANLIRADLSEVDLSGSDLTEAILCNASLTKADLSNANITGAILYGTSREDWIIHDIECDYVFWDDKGMIRDPQNGQFESGEFERLYESLPKLEYIFVNGFTPIDAVVIDQVVQNINSQNPNYDLRLDSFHSRGLPRAIFTISKKEYTSEVYQKIRTKYEIKIAELEAVRDTLKECFTMAIKEPKLVIERLNMDDIIDTNSQSGNIAVVKGQANIKEMNSINITAEKLIREIDRSIRESQGNESDKINAEKQLDKIREELKQHAPEKGRLERYWRNLIKSLPEVAKHIPWKDIIAKIIT
jgi:uncharacterized protein YjbI with pentapeptide repeats